MTGKTGRQSFLLALAPGLFVLLWSTGFIGAKLGQPYAEPLSFLLIRFACVIGLLGLLALVLRRPWPHRPTQWLHIAVAGALLHGGYLSRVFLAIHTGMAAGVVALIVGIQPLLTAFLSASMVGERVNRRQWMGLVLPGFGGVTLVVWDKLGFGGLSGAGFAFSTLALGGFSNYDASVGHYDSPAIEAVLVVFMLISALNFSRHLTTTGIKTNDRGYVITENEPYYGMTTRAGVFAAGDVVHEPQTVILAMREGRRVAEAIDTYLQRG